MSKFKDESGNKFGRLTAISSYSKKSSSGKLRTYWVCQCDCGNTKHISADNLRKKDRVPSCGCFKSEFFSNNNSTHRLSGTRTYRSWSSARQRCTNPNDNNYAHYGARNITVCERWNSFEVFLNDMGEPPTLNHTIERIDVNGNYEPGNCKWATPKEQARNRTNTNLIEYNGKKMILTDWSKHLGIRLITLRKRINAGWPIEKVFSSSNYKYNSPKPLSPID